MSLADRLSEIDRELDALGSAHAEITERARAQWSGKGLDAIDEALMDLSAGVTVVDAPSPRSALPVSTTTRSAPDATTASGSLVAPTPKNGAPQIIAEAHAADTSQPAAPKAEAADDVVAPVSEAASPSEIDSPPTPSALDSLFPEGEPDSETDSVSVGTRALTMSEPPMSEPPPPEPEAPSDDDPFGGMPAPVELPPRRPSMMPASIAPGATPSTPSSTLSMPPKHIPARTIRTSAAPPPPPLPSKSLRPRSISPGGPFKRPSDTPDPFPAQGRASSRPPSTLSADQLFGGTSVSPPADSPVKLSTPPMPVGPATTPPRATTPPAAEEDDFELMIDDDMVEIDMDDVDELD